MYGDYLYYEKIQSHTLSASGQSVRQIMDSFAITFYCVRQNLQCYYNTTNVLWSFSQGMYRDVPIQTPFVSVFYTQ